MRAFNIVATITIERERCNVCLDKVIKMQRIRNSTPFVFVCVWVGFGGGRGEAALWNTGPND